jgi:hypothetical protein
MFLKASLKLGLDHAVLGNMLSLSMKLEDPSRKDNSQEIDKLLKFGAYELLMDPDAEEASKKFCEEDIDEILEKRSTVWKTDESSGGGTFSKATFQSSEADASVEIDAPDFWEKVMNDKDSIYYLINLARGDRDGSTFTDSYFDKLEAQIRMIHDTSLTEQREFALELLHMLLKAQFVRSERKVLLHDLLDLLQSKRKRRPSSKMVDENDDSASRDVEDPVFPVSVSRPKVQDHQLKQNVRDAIISVAGTGRSDSMVWHDMCLVAEHYLPETEMKRLSILILMRLIEGCSKDIFTELFVEALERISKIQAIMSDDQSSLSYHEEWLASHVAKSSKRCARFFRLSRKVHENFEHLETEIRQMNLGAESSISSWWKQIDDYMLLKGVSRFGAHARALQVMFRLDSITFSMDASRDSWPHEDTLERRARSLIDSVLKTHVGVSASPAKSKKSKSVDGCASVHWPRKDKKNLTKYLQMYGQYRFEEIQKHMKHRSIKELKEYFDDYMKQCRFMVTSGFNPSEPSEDGLSLDEVLNSFHVSDHQKCLCGSIFASSYDSLVLCRSCFHWFHQSCVKTDGSDEKFQCERCPKTEETISIPYRELSSHPLPTKLKEACVQLVSKFEAAFPGFSVISDNLRSNSYETIPDVFQDCRRVVRDQYVASLSDTSALENIKLKSKEFEEQCSNLCEQFSRPDVVDQYTSMKMAHRVVERVYLFDLLKRASTIPRDSLINRIAALPPRQENSSLPVFWKAKIHDVFLVDSAQKHGIGVADKILSDESLMKPVRAATPGFGSLQLNSLRELLQDRFPLFRRLRRVLEFVFRDSNVHTELDDYSEESDELMLDEEEPAMPLRSIAEESKEEVPPIVLRDLKDVEFPFECRSGALILSLGDLSLGYSNSRFLFPTGFVSTREYLSWRDPSKRVEYTNRIESGDDGKPWFSVEAADDPEHIIEYANATSCWTEVILRVQDASGLGRSALVVSGPHVSLRHVCS